MSLPGITLFLFIIYVIYKIEFETSSFVQKIKDKRRNKKIEKLKQDKLSDFHPHFWMWKDGDILIISHGKFSGRARLITFSRNYVIAIDENNSQEVTIYARQIESNVTNQRRIRLKEAQAYQQNVLPELEASNKKDLYNLLTEKVQNND